MFDVSSSIFGNNFVLILTSLLCFIYHPSKTPVALVACLRSSLLVHVNCRFCFGVAFMIPLCPKLRLISLHYFVGHQNTGCSPSVRFLIPFSFHCGIFFSCHHQEYIHFPSTLEKFTYQYQHYVFIPFSSH